MISIDEAIQLVENNTSTCSPATVPVLEALGHVLSKDIHSSIDMPPFNQSAMDGYAANWDDSISAYTLIGEIPAGSGEIFELKKGDAVRIFTGAAVPDSANMVVKQEIVVVENGIVRFTEDVHLGMNIRPKGEQIKSGDLALKKGTLLTAGGIGFLATLGLTEVEVIKKPSICILTTGNELVKPGQELTHGKVYESNSIMLEAAFLGVGFTKIHHELIPDNYNATLQAVRNALEKCDLIVLSGGISVGEYDFVGKALNEIGVGQVFYKVNQKPGKPIYFGKHENKMIFALPGNPAAALTSFYTYIYPSLNKMIGRGFHGCRQVEYELTHDYIKKGDRSAILKAVACNGEVEILGAQSSAMLSSFANANALVIILSEIQEIKKGQKVRTLLLP